MEHEYDAVEVDVEVYPQDVPGTQRSTQKARAFITVKKEFLTVAEDLRPTERYLSLIREGAAQSGLDPAYVEWLRSLPCLASHEVRGDEHYRCCGSESKAGGPQSFLSRNLGEEKRGAPLLSLRAPKGVFATRDAIYIADSGNDRVVRVPARPTAIYTLHYYLRSFVLDCPTRRVEIAMRILNRYFQTYTEPQFQPLVRLLSPAIRRRARLFGNCRAPFGYL